MSAEPDGDRDYLGAPVDVLARTLRFHCQLCTAEPGHLCRNQADEVCPPHNARLADAAQAIEAEQRQRFKARDSGAPVIVPAGMTYTPLPDVEVARLRQPIPLGINFQALCGVLESAYGDDLVLRPDGEWLTVVRLSPTPRTPTPEETHRG